MQQPTEQPESTTIALRIPVTQLTYLRQEAKRHESTVSGQVRLLIRQAMEQEREAA